jgi:hypothetical protein
MFTPRYRRKRYPRLLVRYPLDGGDAMTNIQHLVAIWSKLRWSDFSDLPLDKRVGAVLDMGVANLPSLLYHLRHHNKLIEDGNETRLEQRNRNPTMTQEVSLDLFFADDQHLPVDTDRYLRQTAGQLQVLHCHTRKDDGGYYARMSAYILNDLNTLTITLLTIEES